MELAEEPVVPIERIACQFCNRKFVPKSLAKHAVVCEKTLHKKRKTFDSLKQRIQGTELAEYLPAMTTKKNETFTVSKEKPAIVQKMLNTVHNVPSRKSNKNTSPNKLCNYERCPHCDRTFGPKAFDRHIEWCKEQSVRINSTPSVNQEAKERLEARIKYRAPSIRSRRSITREKYSPKSSISDSSSIFVKSQDRNNNDARRKKSLESENKNKFSEKSKPKEPTKETNFIRQNVLRCSYRPRISKKTETKADKEYSSFPNKKKTEYSDVQDWLSAQGTKIRQYPRSSKASIGNSSVTSSVFEDYDPYLLAEYQLRELLGDEHRNNEHMNQTYVVKNQTTPNSSKEERRHKFQNKENISCDSNGPVKTISCQTENGTLIEEKKFKTSPTSAFEKYVVNGNRAPTPVPLDFEDENFLPPIANPKQNSRQMSYESHNINRYPLISLSNLSLCSTVNLDLPEDIRKISSCKSADVRDHEIPIMKRSISAYTDKGSNKNNMKKNLKMENMLYGNEDQQDTNATAITYAHEPLTDDYEDKSEKMNGILNSDEFELAASFSEFENVLQNSYCDNDMCTVRSESPLDNRPVIRERGDSIINKMNIDSAYNSLNRKSPNPFEPQTFCGKTSTPETDVFKSSTVSPSSDSTSSCVDMNLQNQRKLSKFCHECGAKFPLAFAKFCCECGIRRLII